jgi:hypothetical protein
MKILGPDDQLLTIADVATLPPDIETDDEAPTVNPNLLPCPHCGCPAAIHCAGSIFRDARLAWRIECEGECHSMTCWWHSKEEAETWWNRRGPVDKKQAAFPVAGEGERKRVTLEVQT